MAGESEQFCTFNVDRYTFGVEVHKVQEVIRFQHMTRVPLAPAIVRGLINLRGQIVTAIDLRHRIGLPPAPPEMPPMNVILRTEQGPVSLLVDKIGDVREVSRDLFERPPDTLRDIASDMIRGVYKLPDRLLIVIDPERAIAAVATRTQAASAGHSDSKGPRGNTNSEPSASDNQGRIAQ
ncbi:MAG: chemotaxis protein CheW [Deltaproteobacteria bacterium]|nr:chemotaxis protein CheW [Deltaproteobacteria bacterium]